MPPHPLDRPVWQALSTRQRHLAEGGALARRFPSAMGPFAATIDESEASGRALLELIAPDDRIALVTEAEIAAPPGTVAVLRDVVDQMVFEGSPPASSALQLVRLQASDVPAMTALNAVTRPGPFGPRTIEMGTYLGLEADGVLIAMAGERMNLDGYTEVSAVCVDPAHRGKGLAAELVNAVTHGILAREDVPILHVFAANSPAIALYRKLGYARRRQFRLTALTRAPHAG